MENEKQSVEDTSSTEDTHETSTDTTTDDNEVDVEALKAELEKERTARQQLTARAKKAEDQLKALKPKVETEAKEVKQDYPDVDERILKANGMSDELLKELKVIAQARGVSLIDAQNDSLFKLVKQNFEQEIKAKEASLGSSRGSGNATVKKTPSSPGLTRDEHKAFFKKMQ
jgi:uncharacterized protein YllA (UPF0747 family)